MNDLKELLAYRFFDNSLAAWAMAAAAFMATFTVLPLIRSYASRLVRRPGGASRPAAVELILRLIPRTRPSFVLVVALNAGVRFLELPEQLHRALGLLILIGVWFQVGIWAVTAVEYFLERHRRRHDDAAHASSMAVLTFISQVVIWSLVVLLALDNLGVDVTTLVAGLGIGGIAVALAVQTILSDLLASLSITLDKPFAVGDNLVIGDCQGKVEYIGIKSTRLRSVNGEQIILSNADVLKSRIRNFGRMEERRAVFVIDVTYETPRDKLQQVAGLIESAIREQVGVRLDRCHFKEFGPSSLNFEAVFYVLDGQFMSLADAQHDINLRLLNALDAAGIELAYPTQTVYLTRTID